MKNYLVINNKTSKMAQDSLPLKLPKGWVKGFDKKRNLNYFSHPASAVAVWTVPEMHEAHAKMTSHT